MIRSPRELEARGELSITMDLATIHARLATSLLLFMAIAAVGFYWSVERVLAR